MKTCKDCRFYMFHSVNEEAGERIGFCYRYPPNAFASGQSAYPPVTEKTWCGEFKAKGWFKK